MNLKRLMAIGMSKWMGERLQHYTKSYRHLKNDEQGRNHLSQEREHQLIIQYQMISPENKNTCNIIQTENTVFRNTYVYAHACNSNEWKKEAVNLKAFGEEKENGGIQLP